MTPTDDSAVKERLTPTLAALMSLHAHGSCFLRHSLQLGVSGRGPPTAVSRASAAAPAGVGAQELFLPHLCVENNLQSESLMMLAFFLRGWTRLCSLEAQLSAIADSLDG